MQRFEWRQAKFKKIIEPAPCDVRLAWRVARVSVGHRARERQPLIIVTSIHRLSGSLIEASPGWVCLWHQIRFALERPQGSPIKSGAAWGTWHPAAD